MESSKSKRNKKEKQSSAMISEANALGVEGHDDLEQLMLMGSSNLA